LNWKTLLLARQPPGPLSSFGIWHNAADVVPMGQVSRGSATPGEEPMIVDPFWEGVLVGMLAMAILVLLIMGSRPRTIL